MIPSGSMEPTLHGCTNCVNDKIYVNKLATELSNPKQGDVIVFAGVDSWNTGYREPRSGNRLIAGLQDVGAFFGFVIPRENTLVKRVIATEGQTVRCLPQDPGIMVDGKLTNQDFIQNPPDRKIYNGSDACGGKYFGPLTVEDNSVFVMGDNRTNSMDSRYHMHDHYTGSIPLDHVIGKASFIVSPFDRFSPVKSENI